MPLDKALPSPSKPINTTYPMPSPPELQRYSCSWPPGLERRIDKCKAYNKPNLTAANTTAPSSSAACPAMTGRAVKPLSTTTRTTRTTKPDDSPEKEPDDTTDQTVPHTGLKPIHSHQRAADANDPEDQTFNWITSNEGKKLARSVSSE